MTHVRNLSPNVASVHQDAEFPKGPLKRRWKSDREFFTKGTQKAHNGNIPSTNETISAIGNKKLTK